MSQVAGRRRRDRRRLRAAGDPRARRSRRGSPPWASRSRTCARRSPMPTRSARSAASTAPTRGHHHRHQRPAAHAPSEYNPMVVKTVERHRRSACPTSPACEPSVRNSRSAGWFNTQPSVLLIITKQGDANVIETVDRIYELLPEMQALDPGRHRHLGAVRPHPDHPRQRARHAAHARGHHRAGDAGGVRCSCAAPRRRSPPASPCRCRSPAPARRCGRPASRSTTCR